MSQRSLEDWLTYISAQHPSAIALGLDRVHAVWERMQIPLNPIFFTVGGTNGKGSTCAFTEAALRAKGLRTGLYSSPHLNHFCERIRLDGIPIPEERACVLAQFITLVAFAAEYVPSLPERAGVGAPDAREDVGGGDQQKRDREHRRAEHEDEARGVHRPEEQGHAEPRQARGAHAVDGDDEVQARQDR